MNKNLIIVAILLTAQTIILAILNMFYSDLVIVRVAIGIGVVLFPILWIFIALRYHANR